MTPTELQHTIDNILASPNPLPELREFLDLVKHAPPEFRKVQEFIESSITRLEDADKTDEQKQAEYAAMYQGRLQQARERKPYTPPIRYGEKQFKLEGDVLMQRRTAQQWSVKHGCYVDASEPWRVAPARVTHPDRGRVRASIVKHWLQTGEWVERLPVERKEVKPFRAQIRVNGERVSLGYYATREERDAAVRFFKETMK